MRLIARTILILTVSVVLSCSSADSPSTFSCTNLIRRWSIGEEQRFNGPVRSVSLSELVHESEGHFLYLDKKPWLRTKFEFNPSGRLEMETDFALDGKPTSPKVYVYNANGVLIHEYNISGIDGKPYLPTHYSYNDDGTNLEIRQTSDEGKAYSVWTFSNWPESNYSEFVETNADGTFEMKIGIQRDERCRISSLYHFPYFGLYLAKADVKYDENDNMVSVERYAPFGISKEKRKYEYQLDQLGNWIERRDYAWKSEADGVASWQLMNEQFRNIEYYDD